MSERTGDKQEVPSHGVGYRFAINDAHVVETIERSLRSNRAFAWFVALKVLCGLGLVALMLGIVVTVSHQGAAPGLYGMTLVPVAFLVLLIQGAKIDQWLLKRRLRRSPHFGDHVVWVLSDEGISVSSAKAESRLKWSAFTHFKRFLDGVLLYSGTENPY